MYIRRLFRITLDYSTPFYFYTFFFQNFTNQKYHSSRQDFWRKYFQTSKETAGNFLDFTLTQGKNNLLFNSRPLGLRYQLSKWNSRVDYKLICCTLGLYGGSTRRSTRPCQWNPWNHLRQKKLCCVKCKHVIFGQHRTCWKRMPMIFHHTPDKFRLKPSVQLAATVLKLK